MMTPFDLRCEWLRQPLGIDSRLPILSWKLRSSRDARNERQTSYRITVASTSARLEAGDADVWDSGKVRSSNQLSIPYAGHPLSSGQRCFWRVQAWDAHDVPSLPSPYSWWEMGLLDAEDWKGSWISDGRPVPRDEAARYRDDPAPLFRMSFGIDRPVRRARLYAAGLGYVALRINGEAVSDRVLDPPWTAFDLRVPYTCDDLTGRLNQGENVLGALLGNGWYNPLPLRMWGHLNLRDHLAVGEPCLIAQLVVEFEDGTTRTISSNSSWKTTPGPVVRNSVYLGETYDARLEAPGWDSPGFDDSGWIPASAAGRPPAGVLSGVAVPPIRVTARLKPIGVEEVAPGIFVFDFGQNFAGWARLRVEGPRGTVVTMRLGELVHEDGTLNPMTAVAGQIKGFRADGTPRGGPGAPEVAWQSNTYTLRGDGPEEYTPRFTFHGFRYVEVTGFPGRPTLANLEGLRLNTDVEATGSFSCSNGKINRIREMVEWTFLSNLFSVQSDCPAREKFQYGGDIVAASEMAIFGHDMAAFYAKTVRDHADAALQDGWLTETAPFVGISAEGYTEGAGPIGWGIAHPLLVDQLYRYYGDRRLVEEQFETARTWVDLLERHAEGRVVDRCIGDHESLDPKPVALVATAQFFQAASMVARFAEILEKPAEAARYRALAQGISEAFVSRFLEPGTGRFDIATQAAQATALYMGLVPEHETGRAVARMVQAVVDDHGGHVATGIFGTKYLLEMLSRTGHNDVAYGMVDTEAYPGWGFMLANGATTVWETWAPSDNVYSQNHPMFGSVNEWFFKSLAGIRPDDEAVGFDRFRIEPDLPEGLEWVDARYDSARGAVVSRWRRDGDRVRIEVEVPVNSTAVVRIPTRDPGSVTEGGRPLGEILAPGSHVTARPRSLFVPLGSGRYVFDAAAP